MLAPSALFGVSQHVCARRIPSHLPAPVWRVCSTSVLTPVVAPLALRASRRRRENATSFGSITTIVGTSHLPTLRKPRSWSRQLPAPPTTSSIGRHQRTDHAIPRPRIARCMFPRQRHRPRQVHLRSQQFRTESRDEVSVSRTVHSRRRARTRVLQVSRHHPFACDACLPNDVPLTCGARHRGASTAAAGSAAPSRLGPGLAPGRGSSFCSRRGSRVLSRDRAESRMVLPEAVTSKSAIHASPLLPRAGGSAKCQHPDAAS